MRIEEAGTPELKEKYRECAEKMLSAYDQVEDQKEIAAMLRGKLEDGTIMDFYK